MANSNSNFRLRAALITVLAIAGSVFAGAFAFTDFPRRLGWIGSASSGSHDDHESDHDDHSGHDHDHEGHVESESIELSDQARQNMRLTTQTVVVGPYSESIEVPAVVVPWPGRTHVVVTSPLTGVINSINVARGELISSGIPMFTLRLTHQDLVETQKQFLTALGQLDIEEREIERLTSIASSGAIAARKRIEREYERDKLLASLKAAKQSMLLHGLTQEQINRIETSRELVREVTIYVPTLHADRSLHHDSLHTPESTAALLQKTRLASMQPPLLQHDHVETEFLVSDLQAARGQAVQAGEQIAQLSDYSELLIEGFAYQRDGDVLRQAADAGWPIQAVIEAGDGGQQIIDGLKVIYIGNEIDQQSRALSFFVGLPNEIERSEMVDEHRYVSWRYKPGARMQLRVPTNTHPNAIVVPKSAVAEEGPERFVFVENGDHFDRVPVHILASDSINIALQNDGQLWPGQTIAVHGAHQLQMAMKNKSGGAIDPHAGHNH